MKSNFWKSNEGRWTIIGLAYVIIYGAMLGISAIFSNQLAGSGGTAAYGGFMNYSLVVMILFVAFGWPTATRAVTKVSNAIFGNLVLFGPLELFLKIFLVKLVLRCVIALCVGPIMLPYNVGKFVANKVAEMEKNRP